ncbi:OmpW/AlkL family protein [Cupriavidus pinatubonensis]|uniref:Outer membrane protein W n=1 Tax=Cupriavidus pinatubonensis TaxID=248026 RepID=A0ABN7Y6R0_9BURK|nr:OmpW family outer membrane protein [Cupriavidus pinatubonensis]CAG9168396.1 Outer membrane protein W [Cupriavidus pinatubonensis]
MKSTYKKMLAAGAVMALAGTAQAQSAGSNIVSLGWFRVMPNSSADPLTVDSINGRPVNMTRANTGASIESADTLGIAFEHYFTDNISAELVAGIPPKHDVKGTGDYGQYGKLGSVRQWSPAVVVKYHFFDAKTKFRPYVGLGVNYTWFTDETITNQDFVNHAFGIPGAKMTANAESSWNPVFNVGASYAITDNWFVGLSVSYLPLSTRATLTTQANGVTIVSHTKIKIDPVVTFLSVGYKF